MKTRYILAGGADLKAADGGQALCDALASGLGRSVRILSCFFAEPRERWEEKFAAFSTFFKRNLGEETRCELAFPSSFYEQAERADVIYLHGGDDALLAHYMERFPDLAGRVFKGKTVAGSSAGASFLSSYYWTCDWREARPGSGIVPVRVIVHDRSDFGASDPRGPIDWNAARAELEPHLPDLPLQGLPECQFIIMEHDDENHGNQTASQA